MHRLGVLCCFLFAFLHSPSILCCAQDLPTWPTPPRIIAERAAALGVRELIGKHLHLWTDVPSSPAVDELPQVFDAAIGPWCDYCDMSPNKADSWQVQGYLIHDRSKFAALGVLPDQRRDYVNGYAVGNQMWLDEQPSDYYRRHLLLHEGTHAFMLAHLGSAGPGWFMEGIAEMLATHRWKDGQLELGIFPASKAEVPMWGRIRILREAVAAGRPLVLGEVLAIDNRRVLGVDSYAWCWALCEFLDSHPRHGPQFRKLLNLVRRSDFNDRFRRLFHGDWDELETEWEAFVAAVDYGYDTQRMAMKFAEPVPVDQPATTLIATDRGWQAAPWLLRGGHRYTLSATGRYVIARDSEPWPCESNGVTIHYHAGHPLGMLLGVLRSDQPEGKVPAEDSFAKPQAIGLQAILSPHEDSILYLRVNDSPAELVDNEGGVQVEIVSEQ
jgi:hypothetical protein